MVSARFLTSRLLTRLSYPTLLNSLSVKKLLDKSLASISNYFFQANLVNISKNFVSCSYCDATKGHQRSIHTTTSNAKKLKSLKPIVYKKSSKKIIKVWKNMTVQDLANAMDKTVDQVFEIFLFVEGNEDYDQPSSPITDISIIIKTVKLAGLRFQMQNEPEIPDVTSALFKNAFRSPPAPPEDLTPRPPIVTIMGHVDHGKTTLLDMLRDTSIVETEFGGITQHIGAFEVSLTTGEQVTFLDTPGHAAFSAMRARGAQITDMVVLVVAADDGVQPQTKESIKLAHEAGIPIIVAINKIDKAEANIPRCKQMLLETGVQLEELGGEVQAVEISALKGTNVHSLVEALVTQAEVMNVQATKKGLVEAIVIESQQDPRRGKIATCVIQRGTLSKGAVLVADTSWAKVRGLFNYNGKPIERALPGTPVQVMGWKEILPPAGTEVLEVKGEQRAKVVVNFRQSKEKEEKSRADLDAIEKKMEEHIKEYREERQNRLQMGLRRKRVRGVIPVKMEVESDPRPRVSLVLKGDVDGSVDAILDVLDTYQSEEVLMDVLSYGVGNITPSDVEMAGVFKGIIYSFNVPVSRDIRRLAEQKVIPIREYNIIYRLIEDLRKEISNKLPLQPSEEVVGEAVVQQEFLVNEKKKKIPVAGCRCIRGLLKKDLLFKVIRDGEVVHEGSLKAMKHLKQDVGSIKANTDCGLMFEDENVRFDTNDSIVCYKIFMVPQTCDWHPEGF